MNGRIPSTLREWWFGAVPEHWRAIPLKYLCDQSSLYGANIPAEMYESDGVRFLRTTDIGEDGTLDAGGVFVPRELVADYLLAEADFLISRSGTVGRAFVYRETDGPCSYAGYLVRYTFSDRRSARWLFYVTKSAPFALWLGASAIEATIGNVNGEKYANLALPVPPSSTQLAIADFLDRETERIDALVAAKQRLLDLLAEKRKAVIATAVTRGLDPKVKLRDSGVPWLGEIPAHWSTVPLRYLLSLGPKNGISPPQAGSDGELSFSISAVRDGRVAIAGNEKFVDLDHSVASDYYLKSGDILLIRGNGNLSLVGTCGLVQTAPRECTYPDILMLMRVGNRVLAQLLVAAINSPYVREQIESVAQTTNGTYKLSGEDVRTLRLAIPPLNEQHSIVAHVAHETAKLDAIRVATERTMALLKERRSALIAAAVTGQLQFSEATR